MSYQIRTELDKQHVAMTIPTSLNGGQEPTMSRQWYLVKHPEKHPYPVCNDNLFDLYICGEEGFRTIAQDIEKAEHSVDIIVWGFDPAMELVRKGTSWPRGETYGDLLIRKAKAGVRVRLLAWYTWIGQSIQKNLVGFATSKPFSSSPPQNIEQHRQTHCQNWWLTAGLGKIPNLEVRLRSPKSENVEKLLYQTFPHKPISRVEKILLTSATDHQKPILIDYEHPDPKKAVGYVMGLNSITDYWDSNKHEFSPPFRESDWDNDPSGTTIRQPYRDYAIRLQGEALFSLNHNFSEAWDRADKRSPTPLPPVKTHPVRCARTFTELAEAAVAIYQAPPVSRSNSSTPNACKNQTPLEEPTKQQAPAPVKPKTLELRRCQIVRTQPDENDATIWSAYQLAISKAINYIYAENQYLQLPEFFQGIKQSRRALLDFYEAAGVNPKKIPPLHLFIVLSQPDKANLLHRTYEALSEVGVQDQLPEYQKHVRPYPTLVDTLLSPPGGWKEVQSARQELEALGIKVLLAMLQSFDQEGRSKKPSERYRSVYVHSKLMIIDDTFTTLGSANINLRSMAADSEINLITEDVPFARDTRQRVWANLAGSDLAGNAGELDRATTKDLHEYWLIRMKNNKSEQKDLKPFESDSLIATFEDTRSPTLLSYQ